MKKFNLLIILSFYIALSYSLSAQTNTLGSSWSFNQSLQSYSLSSNNGERSMTLDVDFKTPLKKIPQIFLSVTQIDADKETNLRYNVEAISISRDGFTLKVKTWSDSKIFSISGYWLATTD
ncbi:MAG: H-type lectin domain-containing protein [Ignavibacteria bacterium]|nr:H-type lectin domain-containing protein [Ignavibacteria bacterium]